MYKRESEPPALARWIAGLGFAFGGTALDRAGAPGANGIVAAGATWSAAVSAAHGRRFAVTARCGRDARGPTPARHRNTGFRKLNRLAAGLFAVDHNQVLLGRSPFMAPGDGWGDATPVYEPLEDGGFRIANGPRRLKF
jgi:hypothetical protein